MTGIWRIAVARPLRVSNVSAALLTVAWVCAVATPAWPACPPGSNQSNCQGSEPQHQPQAQPHPQPQVQQQPQIQHQAPVQQQVQPQFQQHQLPVQQQVQPQFQHQAPVQQQVQPQFQHQVPVQQQVQPQFQHQAPVQQQGPPQFQQHQGPEQQQAQPQFQHQHDQGREQQQGSQPGAAGSAFRSGPGSGGVFRSGGAPVRDSHAGAFSYHGQSYAPFRASRYRWPNGMGYRRYGVGAYLPLGFIVSAYVLADWMVYGLAAPPPGDQWVRYGPDVLLVDPSTGQIVDGAYSAFAEGDEAPPQDYGQAAQPPPPPGGYAPQLPPQGGPQTLGNFGNWVAAAYQENGQPVCYATTQAVASTPSVPNRAPPVLTVTERATGRDAVSIGGILAGAGNGGLTLQVGRAGLDFYPAGTTAFANNGAAAVLAFQAGSQAAAQTLSPYNVPITDMFSLIGFSAAYAAINAACPGQ